jgi:drug/metabolite transporter (DMT)-like permease
MTMLLLILLNVILLVAGQCSWKLALRGTHLTEWTNWIPLMAKPAIWAGCVLYAGATLLWLFILSRYDLSRVYPLQSLAYLFGALSGICLFKEAVSFQQWIGMAMILGGVVFFARA